MSEKAGGKMDDETGGPWVKLSEAGLRFNAKLEGASEEMNRRMAELMGEHAWFNLQTGMYHADTEPAVRAEMERRELDEASAKAVRARFESRKRRL